MSSLFTVSAGLNCQQRVRGLNLATLTIKFVVCFSRIAADNDRLKGPLLYRVVVVVNRMEEEASEEASLT